MNDQKPPARSVDYEAARSKLKEALMLWVGNRPLDQAMTREKLAELEGARRGFTLSKSLIPNMIGLCRRDPRFSGTQAAVLLLITMLADNNKGLCVVGIKRMAELLDRKEETISLAIKGLEVAGVVGVNRTPAGMIKSYWPKVPTIIADMTPHVADFVNALSAKPSPRGRPYLATSQGNVVGAGLAVAGADIDATEDGINSPRSSVNHNPATINSPRSSGKFPPVETPQYSSMNSSEDFRPDQTTGG